MYSDRDCKGERVIVLPIKLGPYKAFLSVRKSLRHKIMGLCASGLPLGGRLH